MLPVATVCKQNLEDVSRTDHASMLEILGTELVEGSGGGADPECKRNEAAKMNADLDHMRQRVGRIRKCLLSLDENEL
jgi:hypothetical protein